jgi:hypothetical protein
MFLVFYFMDWRDGSVVKSTGCSSEDLGSVPSARVLGNPTPSLASVDTKHKYGTYTSKQANIHTHKIKINTSKYLLISHPNCSFPSLLSSHVLPSLSLHPLLFPFSSEKKICLYGYHPAMTHQAAVRLGTSFSIEASHTNPVGEGQAAESETAPAPSVRSPTRSPSFTTVTHI